MGNAGTTIKKGFKTITDPIVGLFKNAGDVINFGNVMKQLMAAWNQSLDKITSLVSSLPTTVEDISKAVQNLMQIFLETVKVLASPMTIVAESWKLLAQAFSALTTAVTSTITWLLETSQTVFKDVHSLVAHTLEQYLQVSTALFEFFKRAFMGSWGEWAEIISSADSIVQRLAKLVVLAFDRAVSHLEKLGKDVNAAHEDNSTAANTLTAPATGEAPATPLPTTDAEGAPTADDSLFSKLPGPKQLYRNISKLPIRFLGWGVGLTEKVLQTTGRVAKRILPAPAAKAA